MSRGLLPRGEKINETFMRLGMNIFFRKEKRSTSRNVCLSLFRSHFGIDPETAAYIWVRTKKKNKVYLIGSRPVHLLWGLLFMKVYSSEKVMCSMCGGVDPKTFRKWSKIFVKEIGFYCSEEVSVFIFTD